MRFLKRGEFVGRRPRVSLNNWASDGSCDISMQSRWWFEFTLR